MMILQSDPAWATARLGHVTASRIADIVAKTKTGASTSRANYAAELIAERLTGAPAERYVNGAMQWGLDTEERARAAYAFRLDEEPAPAAFVTHPSIEWAGASPDGFLGDAGLVEFKCPNTATHIETVLGAPIPSRYFLQMQWQMACAGRAWCDFVSFDPRLSEELSFFRTRINRDEKAIESLEKEVGVFLSEVAEKLAALHDITAAVSGEST